MRDMIMLQRGLRFIEVLSSTTNRAPSVIIATLSIVTLGMVLASCSSIGINDGSLDYKNAQSIAPIQVPDTFKTRQIAPLYPVPVVPSNSASAALVLSKGDTFIVPKPKSLDAATVTTAQIGDGTPSAPQLVIDGNGYPIIKVSGDASKIWDIINRTLSVANVNITARNAAASRFDVVIDKVTYQLRLGRIGNVTTIILQKADDSLADKAIAKELLERITQNWSA
ncbi:MAG: hypothetical protein NVS3B3_17760 [Aquirhabdus sp.]